MTVGNQAADALRFAGALARELAGIAAGRLWGGSDPPRRIEDLSVGWLGSLLSARAPGQRVSAVRCIEAHAGTTARARIALETEGGGELPATLFVKLAPPDLATRSFGNLMQLGRTEVRFYRELRPSLPVRAPRLFASSLREPGGRFALLLEDLAAAGASFRDITTPCSPAEARAVVLLLARLHAAFWSSPRLREDLAWLRSPWRHPFARVERFTRERMVARGLRSVAERLPPDQHAAASGLGRRWQRLEVLWRQVPHALLHGDPHLGNLYFVGGEPGLLDWQVAQQGDPFRDLVYFLVLSLDVETRRRHERELLRVYLDALAKQGVGELSFDEAWDRYRRNAFYPWVAALATAGVPTLQARHIQQAGVDRSCAALDDLDTLAALDSPT